MKYLTLLVLSLAISLVTSGQPQSPDYVVTLKNDTLRGIAQIFTYDIIDRVQFVDGKKKESFTAVQVRAVSLRGELYHPVKIESGYFMMKLVKSGFLSLYYGHQPKTSVYDTPYLVKRGGQNIEVPNLSFKKYVTQFLVECSVVQEKVRSGELGKRDLEKIVDEFNICTSHESQPSADTSSPTLTALSNLRTKLGKDSSLTVQKDVLDILSDISEKVKSKQEVPNYLIEGLKSQLKDSPDYQKDIESIVNLLKAQ